MNWSITFDPQLPRLLLETFMVPLALLALVGLGFRQRSGCFKLATLAALGLTLSNPVILDEERELLKSVVAIVTEQSQSQGTGERTAQTNAVVKGLKERLARFRQFEMRVIDAGHTDDRTETRLFAELESAFHDIPPSRIGGAVMITDGQVHDVPTKPLINTPLQALITGNADERDRRIRFEQAQRFGIIGMPLGMTYRVIDNGGKADSVDVRARRLRPGAAALEPLVPSDRRRAAGGRSSDNGCRRPAVALARPQGRRPRACSYPTRVGYGRAVSKAADRMYRSIAHWVMKESQLEEERLIAEGRGMVFDFRRQTMHDKVGSARIITPSGKTLDVQLNKNEPGIFTVSVETREIGFHKVCNGDLIALAHVGPVNAPEFADVVST